MAPLGFEPRHNPMPVLVPTPSPCQIQASMSI